MNQRFVRLRKGLRAGIIAITALCIASVAQADVQLCKVFSDHMVLQRNKPIPVFGTAAVGEKITVSFGGKTLSTTADELGNWRVNFPTMEANTKGQSMTITGNNTITISDVLVGDVWLCSGQSNMDMTLGGCNRQQDIDSANFPGIRSFRTPGGGTGTPQKMVKGDASWSVCAPSTAGKFSATAFYFARKIYQETKGTVPIGLLTSSVGGTPIDLWVAPEGVVDIPGLKPLMSQPVLPDGPFRLSHGMIAPLAPYGIKGAIWYQGENAEKSVQTPDSYFLKMKGMVQGWKRLFEMDDFPFYYVMIANWGEKPKDSTPLFRKGGWDADTRLQQANAMALPHAGCASAIDIGDYEWMGNNTWEGWHPKDKLDVGERLALWALKNDYGRPNIVASGPTLRDATVSGGKVVCSFDNIGSGLMVGSRTWYKPTQEIKNGELKLFVIAGADGKWFPATAKIKGNNVVLSSPSVPNPRKISYACWQNPEGCNLYNKEGLPASPFHIEDVTKHFVITAKAGQGGTISPSGESQYLQRMTTLYTIKPKPSYYIEDVKVDGQSVGSVTSYTFDPIYDSHSIEATFSRTAPSYNISVSANRGGMIKPVGLVSVSIAYSSKTSVSKNNDTPSRTVSIPQGGSKTFTILPREGIIVESLEVDGVNIGPRDRFTFSDVRSNHSLKANFAVKVKAEAGFGGRIVPSGDVTAKYGDGLAFSIEPIDGYSVESVLVDGKEIGPELMYTFSNVTSAHSISVKFKGGPDSTGSVPQTDKLIFTSLSDYLPSEGRSENWTTVIPEGGKLTPISTPTTEVVSGKRFSMNSSLDGDGFSFKNYTEPIPCNGASIVVVAKPVTNGASSGWNSIVDVFYDRLTLGIRNDSGLVCVRRNGPIVDSKVAIPNGQTTILSLIVQPDGTYKVYANGVEIMANSEKSDMKALTPGEAGFAKSITVGRNAPDAWTTYNGYIGDVFLYKTALTDDERKDLETFITHRLLEPNVPVSVRAQFNKTDLPTIPHSVTIHGGPSIHL